MTQEPVPSAVLFSAGEQPLEKFTRAELESLIAYQEGISLSQASRIAQIIPRGILLGLAQGARVYYPQLGVFHANYVPSRPGRNPKTGEEIMLKAAVRLQFSAAQPALRFLNDRIDFFASRAAEADSEVEIHE